MHKPNNLVFVTASALILSACQSVQVAKELPVHEKDIELTKIVAKKIFPTVEFDYKTIVKADINCDKKADIAVLGYDKNNAYIMVLLGDLSPNSKQSTMAMGRGGQAHTYLCGMKAQLRVEDLIKPLEDDVGELEGYKESKSCKGVNVSDGMCDAFHFYWNHKSDSLSSWRM